MPLSEKLQSNQPRAVRARMAPSPTGFLQFGNVRTFLFNYLFAKKNNGSLILRIEDTDTERSSLEFEKDIIDNLKWMGIVWDEGPDVGGKFGPYRQSERINFYKEYLEKLLDENKAYRCFCSEEELEAQRQYQMSQGEAPKYSGKCANLPKEEIQKNLAKGRASVIRFRVPEKKVDFSDLIKGNLEFDASLIGDIIIAKTVSIPLYNFAVVVDDFAMEISHVIRGEDHISNTPKQILIQEALGFPRLSYAHLPIILGPDKTKLSKRHGSFEVSKFRKEGYLADALINFLAFLGWNPGGEKEIYSLASLVKEFSFEKVQKGGAIFNIKKLEFLNGFYIRQHSLDEITELCIPYLVDAGFIDENKEDIETLKKIISLYHERLKIISEIIELTDFFFKEKLEYEKELLRWKDMKDGDVKDILGKLENILAAIDEKNWTKQNLENVLLLESERIGDKGKVLWPLRVSLTGKKASASPFEIAELLGKEKTLKRIKEAKELMHE